RIVKTAVDRNGNEVHTVTVSPSLELRSTTWEAGDYTMDATTTSVVVSGAGVQARVVVHSPGDVPTVTSGNQHLFLELSGQLGSTAIVIDHATGELVEYATYHAYGSVESDYRPTRWGSFREPRKFSGKEDDAEVGLTYFGKRYLSNGLGRWMSPDPA